MDLKRLRELSGIPANDNVFEAADDLQTQLKQWEAAYKAEVDPRARSVAIAKIKKLKELIAAQ